MLKPRISLQDSGLFLTFAPAKKIVVDHSSGRASDASSKNSRHFFYALIIAKSGCLSERLTALWVSHHLLCNGKRSRFICAPGYEERGSITDDALCRQPFISGRFSPQLFPKWKQLQRTSSYGGRRRATASVCLPEKNSPTGRSFWPTPASSLASWPSWVQWPSSITYSE